MRRVKVTKQRCDLLEQGERTFCDVTHMPPGPERDEALREADAARMQAGYRTVKKRGGAAHRELAGSETNHAEPLAEQETYADTDARLGATALGGTVDRTTAAYWADMFPNEQTS